MHIFQEKEQQMEELNAKEEELLKGNPLLNAPTSFSVKRRLASFEILFLHESWWDYINCWRQILKTIFAHFRWDDDVVFKNQARGEMKAPKRFINDTIRNDFHRKFLHRYMKWLENKNVICYCLYDERINAFYSVWDLRCPLVLKQKAYALDFNTISQIPLVLFLFIASMTTNTLQNGK